MPDHATYRAPGRANLIGEHTDYTDGLVLPVAIDRAVTLDAEVGGDRIVLASSGAAGRVDVPADGSMLPAGGWGRMVAAVAAELDAAGREPVGLAGRLSSDLPQGAGLSSSAALQVVVALALVDAASEAVDRVELARLCRRAENRALGVPSGVMDQAASLLGEADHAIVLDCQSMAHRAVPLPEGHALLIIDSGTSRQLEHSGYRQRVEELAAALPVLDGRRPADVDVEELDELLSLLDPIPARRLRHVVTENARVRATEAALRAHDLGQLGDLFDAGHTSLRDDFEVSTPELDTLVELARDAGATAARMTGGGFGGAIVALVPDRLAGEVAEAVVAGYDHRHAAQRATVHRCRAAAGAARLD